MSTTTLEELLWKRSPNLVSAVGTDFEKLLKQIIKAIASFRKSNISIDKSLEAQATGSNYPFINQALPTAEELFLSLASVCAETCLGETNQVKIFNSDDETSVVFVGNKYASFNASKTGLLRLENFIAFNKTDLQKLNPYQYATSREVELIINIIVESNLPRYAGSDGMLLFLGDFAWYGYQAYYNEPDGRGSGDISFDVVYLENKNFYFSVTQKFKKQLQLSSTPRFISTPDLITELEFSKAKIDIVDDSNSKNLGFTPDGTNDIVVILTLNPDSKVEINDIELILQTPEGLTHKWVPKPRVAELPLAVCPVRTTVTGGYRIGNRYNSDAAIKKLATGLSFESAPKTHSGFIAIIFQSPEPPKTSWSWLLNVYGEGTTLFSGYLPSFGRNKLVSEDSVQEPSYVFIETDIDTSLEPDLYSSEEEDEELCNTDVTVDSSIIAEF